MKKIPTLFLICFVILSCGPDRSTPEYAAKQYLTALKNKDWETAMKYATPATREQIEMMKSLGTDFGITEIRDIRCEVKGSKAMCYYCCTKESDSSKVLFILNKDNHWVANSSKGSWLDYQYWDSIK